MHRHLLLGDFQEGGNRVARRLRVLRTRPRHATVARHARHRGGRLHGRVREVRCVVLGLHLLRGAGERSRGVAEVAHLVALGTHRCLEFLAVARRVVAVVRGRRPRDDQLLAPLHCRPRGRRDHRDAAQRHEPRRRRRAGNLDHLLHALDLERGRRVELLDLGAVHRRVQHDGDLHPRHARVLPEDRLAREDRREIVSLDVAPDVLELCVRLERRVRGHRQRARAGHELAKAERTIGRHVRHAAVARDDVGRRHAPLVGCGPFEHRTGSRPRLSELHVRAVPDARRAVGVLVTVLRVANRLLKHDRLVVHVELVGDGHHERRANALPHLGAVADHGHGAVLADAQVHRRLPRAGGRRDERTFERFEPAHARGAHGQQQAAGGELLQKGAALDLH